MMKIKRTTTSLLLFILLVLNPIAPLSTARADDLIIHNDGLVILVITSEGVLGVSTINPTTTPTTPPSPTSPATKPVPPTPIPSSPPPSPASPAKSIPLVPAHVESVVSIAPSTHNDKKVQITISKATPPAPAPAPTTSPTPATISPQNPKPTADNTPTLQTTPPPAPSPTPPPAPSTPSSQNITKTVDQVTALGASGQPVLSIKSEKKGQLTITQGSVQATTPLPLQINTLTHSVSTPSTQSPIKVAVLPAEAVQGITGQGLLKNTDRNQTKISLTQEGNGLNYTVQSTKRGKLFGFISVESPVEVKLSASTGKIVNVSQSSLFSLLGGFIR